MGASPTAEAMDMPCPPAGLSAQASGAAGPYTAPTVQAWDPPAVPSVLPAPSPAPTPKCGHLSSATPAHLLPTLNPNLMSVASAVPTG